MKAMRLVDLADESHNNVNNRLQRRFIARIKTFKRIFRDVGVVPLSVYIDYVLLEELSEACEYEKVHPSIRCRDRLYF